MASQRCRYFTEIDDKPLPDRETLSGRNIIEVAVRHFDTPCFVRHVLEAKHTGLQTVFDELAGNGLEVLGIRINLALIEDRAEIERHAVFAVAEFECLEYGAALRALIGFEIRLFEHGCEIGSAAGALDDLGAQANEDFLPFVFDDALIGTEMPSVKERMNASLT